MLTIKDCSGGIVCKANTPTGHIEMKYENLRLFAAIPIGGTCIVERDNITTQITRTDTSVFDVKSYSII